MLQTSRRCHSQQMAAWELPIWWFYWERLFSHNVGNREAYEEIFLLKAGVLLVVSNVLSLILFGKLYIK